MSLSPRPHALDTRTQVHKLHRFFPYNPGPFFTVTLSSPDPSSGPRDLTSAWDGSLHTRPRNCAFLATPVCRLAKSRRAWEDLGRLGVSCQAQHLTSALQGTCTDGCTQVCLETVTITSA